MALSRTVRAYYLRFLAKPMINLLFVSIILQSARIFDALWPGVSYFGLLGIIVSLAMGLFLCLINRTPVTAVWALGIVGFLAMQNFVFAFNSGSAINLNALIGYLPIISFVLVRQRVVTTHYLLRTLVFYTLAYLAFYLGYHAELVELPAATNPALLVGDNVREPRIFVMLELASFVVFYATMSRRMNILYRALALALGFAALWYSGSRTFQVLFSVIYVLHLLKLMGLGTRVVLFGVFLTVSAILLSGLFIPWNPMVYISGDNSGLARAMEYGYGISGLQKHWITGVGLWNDFQTFQDYLGTPRYNPLFPSDLGVLGPYIVFGLAGLIAYILATYFCIVPRLRKLNTPGMRALRLNCVLCGTYGIISPAIFLESQTFFLSMLIAAVLRTRRPPRALKPRSQLF